jgi:phosphoribosylpyrophosphate synthetase
LIIDDAIGSGGTVNEIARKLKQRFQVKRCHAYAVVGSYKEFDVIAAV